MTVGLRTVGECDLVWAVNVDRSALSTVRRGELGSRAVGLGSSGEQERGRGGGLLSYLCGERYEAAERLACRR